MVGMEMVTLVSSADILGDLGLRTSNKYFGISFIQMKRKGVEYCPVIMRYATVKREIAQDRCMVTYAQFGQAFLEQMVFSAAAPPPPPPPPGKNCPDGYVYSAKAAPVPV